MNCRAFQGACPLPTLALVAAVAFAGIASFVPVSQAQLPLDAPYSESAHHHWVWHHNGANQTQVIDLVQGFLSRGMRVGVLNIDSEWETGFNTFAFDGEKFPDPRSLISSMHAQNIKVIAWITSFINVDSPNYAAARNAGYLLRPEKPIHWWHGHGSLLDYDNPSAVAWWHSLMDSVLDMGLDGFKTDGSDPYVLELLDLKESWDHYRTLYYSDFWYYVRARLGNQALLMSRPVDCMPPGSGLVHFSFSPRDVVFSGWVGDQDPTFEGMKVALGNMFESARRGYVGFGSDTGGYRSDPSISKWGRTKELFIRWSQLGAFCPLFENGGASEGNEHRPWMFDDETTAIYADLVNMHYKIVPYLFDTGIQAYYGNFSIMQPMDVGYQYLLGSDVFVAPVTEANATGMDVLFPGTSLDQWASMWNASMVFSGGSMTRFALPSLHSFPAFLRVGSIIPMYDTARASLDTVVLVQVRPDLVPPSGPSEFMVHRQSGLWKVWLSDSRAAGFAATAIGSMGNERLAHCQLETTLDACMAQQQQPVAVRVSPSL